MTAPRKPIVFFSHSSKDVAALSELKSLVLRKSSGAVEVFLSSDGSSIPFGTNWVYEIQEALDHCQLMFVFLTKNSLLSPWTCFEAGHAYSKGIRVVPIGLGEIALSGVSGPLSLLQGFDVHTKESLGNVVATINAALDLTADPQFSDLEWSQFQGLFAEGSGEFLGIDSSLVREVQCRWRGLVTTGFPSDAIVTAAKDLSLDFQSIRGEVRTRGAWFRGMGNQGVWEVDCLHLLQHSGRVFPLVDQVTKRFKETYSHNGQLAVVFLLEPGALAVSDIHEVAGSLPSESCKYSEIGDLEILGLEVRITSPASRGGRRRPEPSITFIVESATELACSVGKVFRLLSDYHVLRS